MRIILLSGKQNTGKTCTLEMLAEKLEKEKGATLIPEADAPEDIYAADYVFEYKSKKIAIKFDGDVYHWCIGVIVRYAVYDVLVLAYSDKFSWSLAKLVEDYAPQCGHKVIRKEASDKKEAWERDNANVCNAIFDLL
jgi:tRNA uridine 5-carbamoylmethylation protein Kti12